MTRPIPKVNYADEIVRLQNQAGQCESELKAMVDELRYISPAVSQLKALAQNFSPPPEDRSYIQVSKRNVPKANPPEELAILLQKIRFASESLARASELLAERRSALDALLR